MNASIGTRAEEREAAEAILNSGQDAGLLKLLRDETTLVMLMVRVEVQRRREEWEAENNADITWEEI
jgi:hypothetical protein